MYCIILFIFQNLRVVHDTHVHKNVENVSEVAGSSAGTGVPENDAEGHVIMSSEDRVNNVRILIFFYICGLCM